MTPEIRQLALKTESTNVSGLLSLTTHKLLFKYNSATHSLLPFGHPTTHRAPLPSYILADDTFPQLPYQCTGIISQKLLAWEPEGDIWDGGDRVKKQHIYMDCEDDE